MKFKNLFIKKFEEKNIEYQNKLLEKQVQEVQNPYMTIRGWRHDYLDDEYITKKRGNHGHGLRRINLVVEKYEGYINRQNEAGVFITEIMLPL